MHSKQTKKAMRPTGYGKGLDSPPTTLEDDVEGRSNMEAELEGGPVRVKYPAVNPDGPYHGNVEGCNSRSFTGDS